MESISDSEGVSREVPYIFRHQAEGDWGECVACQGNTVPESPSDPFGGAGGEEVWEVLGPGSGR